MYTFSDVLIKPKFSDIASRSDVDTGTVIGGIKLELPVFSANMKTITGFKMAKELAKYGAIGALHRFNTIEEAVEEFKATGNDQCVVSVGVKEEGFSRFVALYEAGARLFCIDVAHGHHVHVKNILSEINKSFLVSEKDFKIIAGNVATQEGALDLIDWGANIVKVGIGPSKVCHTRTNTGVGVPQLSALEEIHKAFADRNLEPDFIADGGITSVGDICKALKFSKAVMIGGMLSGTSETPGHVFKREDGSRYKTYMGSASGENKNNNLFVEGTVKTVPFNGKVKYILREIKQGLQSSCSYVGARNLQEFRSKCEFIHISSGSRSESKF